ncbi:spore coat protein CotH [Rasiella rasia]|uniref:Spore coat protein CotH n=1 Tax=Rasiella rasia TaxID=2744027 RepID=A0A6G6GIN9_9FLAO|nr:CotH kinase family protein [Rasiella rasia]QIE58384.1 spore coat protein CotH [Rasiella rasia]
MKTTKLLLVSGALSLTLLACGQNSPNFKAQPDSYQIDHEKNIIVVNIDAEDDITHEISSVTLDEVYELSTPVQGLQNTQRYEVIKGKESYSLFITKSPIISIQVKDSLTKHPKVLGHFRYFDADTTFSSVIGMDLRGNLSLTYPKKSFNIEFYTDSVSKGKKELKFKDLRKEDDWILDGLYNEPLLLRAYTSQKLWKDIHTPWYAEDEPKARATVDGVYVDLFVNNEYRGVYLLSEKIKRSLLKLKKMKGDTVRGELFKAGYYHGGTSFKEAPEFKNSLPTWAGWEMEYPYEDYTAHYNNLHKAINFVISSDATDFDEQLGIYFDEENMVDYFLFANLIRATDNFGKNFYLAKYKEETAYFIVPWDMDGVLGTIQAGKRIPTTNDVLSNNLFDRMVANPRLKYEMGKRWKDLRTTSFHTDSLIARIEKRYNKLADTKMYERDELAWNKSHEAEHLTYMLDWLQKRLTYLDTYFTEE